MMKHWLVSCSVACSLLLGAASAQASTGADALKGGVGNWKCTPDQSSSLAGTDHFAIVSSERFPGDWYVSWVIAFHGDKSEKKVLKVRYDEARKHYVLFIFGEDGTHGYGIADADTSNGLAFKGELFKADGTDVKFTKTFKANGSGYSVTWAPEGGESFTANCVK